MYATSCFLCSIAYETDSIGVQKEVVTKKEVPIVKIEQIYASEFYKAHEVGFKPKLKIRLNNLSYNDETELIFNSQAYTVIRTQNSNLDEVILTCERKVKDLGQQEN